MYVIPVEITFNSKFHFSLILEASGFWQKSGISNCSQDLYICHHFWHFYLGLLRWMVTLRVLLCCSIADTHGVWVRNIIWQASNHDNLETSLLYSALFCLHLRCTVKMFHRNETLERIYILNIYSSKPTVYTNI